MTDLGWLDEAIRGSEVLGLGAQDIKDYRQAMLEEALRENSRQCDAAAEAWAVSLRRLAGEFRRFGETVLSIPGLAEAVPTGLEMRGAVERELATRTDRTLPEP